MATGTKNQQEMRAGHTSGLWLERRETEALGTSVSGEVEGQDERLCISRLSLHAFVTKLLSRRGEAMPGCEHLCWLMVGTHDSTGGRTDRWVDG